MVAERQATATEDPSGVGLTALLQDMRRDAVFDREWHRLADVAVEANPFFDPGFLLPAARALAASSGRPALALGRSTRGELIALAPIFDRRVGGIARARSVWVHDYGPLGSPLLDRSRAEEAADALLAIAASDRGLVVPHLPLDGLAAAALREAASARGRAIDIVAPYRRAALIRRPGVNPDLRAAQSSKRRKEFARQMRRLGELGGVTIEEASAPAAVEAAFDAFLVLEQAGWKGAGGSALASLPVIAGFAREAVMAQAAGGRCRANSLCLNGRPIAVALSFLRDALVCTWKIAHDPQFERFSPGAQLMLELGTLLLGNPAVDRVDSLAVPDHPMIDHLWDDRLAIGTLVLGPPRRSALFRLGIASARIQASTRERLRAVRRHIKSRSRT